MGTRAPRRGEAGIALPTPLALVSVVLVAVAGLFFLGTGGQAPQRATTVANTVPGSGSGAGSGRGSDGAGSGSGEDAGTAASAAHQRVAKAPSPLEKKKRKPVQRNEVYLEVYNNSNITGLAGETTARATAIGWQVLATDNWYGTIPASTIYYPDRLYRAAQLLSDDLGIERVKPAIDPMSRDRLTVVLTYDYSG